MCFSAHIGFVIYKSINPSKNTEVRVCNSVHGVLVFSCSCGIRKVNVHLMHFE